MAYACIYTMDTSSFIFIYKLYLFFTLHGQDIVTKDHVDVTQIVHRVPWKYSSDDGPNPPIKPKRRLCRRKTETDLDKFNILDRAKMCAAEEHVVPKTAQVSSYFILLFKCSFYLILNV